MMSCSLREQSERMQRLTQIVAGRREEARFRDVGMFGSLLLLA